MNCRKVQFLMCLYIADDPALTAKERSAFANHLQNCQECAGEYEESRFVIDLAMEHWQVSEDSLALIEKANKYDKPRMTVKEGWEDLKHRIPELAQPEKHQERLQLSRRVGAIAACLAIGILIFLAFSYSKPEIAPKPTSQQFAFAPKPYVKIELKSATDRLAITDNEHITTNNELNTLIINNKHLMMMNTNTSLSIEPLVENGRIGCIVILNQGEIYTNVEHDGKPFVVTTAHGKAVITGTTFDIKATNASTTLVVTEGIVQFESQEGFVEVTTGQISETVGHLCKGRSKTAAGV